MTDKYDNWEFKALQSQLHSMEQRVQSVESRFESRCTVLDDRIFSNFKWITVVAMAAMIGAMVMLLFGRA